MAADTTTIARPYAEAAFACARETGTIPAWTDALDLLAAIAEEPTVADQISNRNVPRERIRDLILDVGGDALGGDAGNLVRLLADNNRFAVLPQIATLFEELMRRQQGVTQVQVLSAYAISADQQKELADALKAKLGADVELTVERDPSLIGGVQIHAGDLVIDGSVRGKLQQLATELQF